MIGSLDQWTERRWAISWNQHLLANYTNSACHGWDHHRKKGMCMSHNSATSSPCFRGAPYDKDNQVSSQTRYLKRNSPPTSDWLQESCLPSRASGWSEYVYWTERMWTIARHSNADKLHDMFTQLVAPCHWRRWHPLLRRSQRIVTTKTRIVSTLMINLLTLISCRNFVVWWWWKQEEASVLIGQSTIAVCGSWAALPLTPTFQQFMLMQASTFTFEEHFYVKMSDDSLNEKDLHSPTNSKLWWQMGRNQNFLETTCLFIKEVDELLGEDAEAPKCK